MQQNRNYDIDLNWQSVREIVPTVSRETTEDLLLYEKLVIKWQAHINLVANGSLNDLWQRHILDSAQIFPLKAGAKNWCDIGSGGGFPAIVIAIFLKHHSPRGHINLVESNGKKAAFLRSVIAELELPATVYHCRIETVYDEIAAPEVLTARALTALDGLLNYARPWLSAKTIALYQKGREYREEIKQADANWCFDLVKHQSQIDAQSVILEISNLRFKAAEIETKQTVTNVTSH